MHSPEAGHQRVLPRQPVTRPKPGADDSHATADQSLCTSRNATHGDNVHGDTLGAVAVLEGVARVCLRALVAHQFQPRSSMRHGLPVDDRPTDFGGNRCCERRQCSGQPLQDPGASREFARRGGQVDGVLSKMNAEFSDPLDRAKRIPPPVARSLTRGSAAASGRRWRSSSTPARRRPCRRRTASQRPVARPASLPPRGRSCCPCCGPSSGARS